MSQPEEPLIEWRNVDGVTVARVLSGELRQPEQAVELGRQIETLMEQEGVRRMLLDMSRVEYMGSTGFATLMVLARKAAKAGGQIKLCGMQPEVLFGANILGLGSIMEIHLDEQAALGTF